jgi:hypothetical protein
VPEGEEGLHDDEQGLACTGCKAQKYGCNHTGKFDAPVMRVMRPFSGSELEGEVVVMVVGRKGKEQQGDLLVQVKKEKRP